MPVAPDALVLDVGSGDKPHWRADVLLDRFAGEEHGVQRSGRAAARLPRPLFDADAADMPFANAAFDYVICSHVLEHVLDPGAVIDEMVRAATAGYIEVPRVTSAKILDFPSHLWWCDLDGDELVFVAKRRAQYDDHIQEFVSDPAVRRDLQRLFDRNFDACIIRLPWSGKVRYRVEGRPDPALVGAIAGAEAHHRSVESGLSRLLTSSMSMPARVRQKRRHPTYNDVIKPSLRRDVDEPLRRGTVISV